MPDKNTNELINHLLFHKALISEDCKGEKIDGFLELVKNIDSGKHIAITDEYEKSISLVFELTMEHQLNPWDIDLVKFAKLYLGNIRKKKEIDLVAAGKIVFMAWSILKLQSDDLLTRIDLPEEEEFYFEGWNILPDDLSVESEALDYTSAVISEAKIPIHEKIWHKQTRNVTLMELVDAFSEAQIDIEKQKVLSERRARLRELLKPNEDFDEKVHKEDLEEDIYVTWQRICLMESDDMILEEIMDGSRDDLIARFVSILHLAMEDKVKIYQRRFPYGEIVIKNITPVEDRLKAPTVELVTEKEEEAVDKIVVKEIMVA